MPLPSTSSAASLLNPGCRAPDAYRDGGLHESIGDEMLELRRARGPETQAGVARLARRSTPVRAVLPPHGVFVLESHHAADFRMAPSTHSFFELFYVLEGRGTIRVGNQLCDVRADDLVVVPPETVHEIQDHLRDPMSLYAVCIAPAVFGCQTDSLRAFQPGLLPISKLAVPQVRGMLRELLFEQTSELPGNDLKMLGLILQMAGTLVRGAHPAEADFAFSGASQGSAAAVRRYVLELSKAVHSPTDIDDAASRLGISRRRFTDLFKSITGSTWLQWVIDRRVEYACQLLQKTDRSITAIAFECGFEELSSFYRAFKRRMGMPPRQWRRQIGTAK